MEEVYKFLKNCGTYYLATTEGNQPRVRPFGTVNIYEGKLYIQTGKSKSVSKQILENPNVELCGVDGDTWIRVAGILEEDGREEAQQAMLNNYPELQQMYKAGDGNTQVFCFKHGKAIISSFTADQKEITF